MGTTAGYRRIRARLAVAVVLGALPVALLPARPAQAQAQHRPEEGWRRAGWAGHAQWGGWREHAGFAHGGGFVRHRAFAAVGYGGSGWDWRRAWGWQGASWGWGGGAWAWGGLGVGVSFGLIVAPPVVVLPPPIYLAPPPIVLGLPAIAPPPVALAPPPPAVAEAPPAPPPVATGGLIAAAVAPPVVVLPPPAIVAAAAPPPVILAPPAFGLVIAPPELVVAGIGPAWWSGGFITGGGAGFAPGLHREGARFGVHTAHIERRSVYARHDAWGYRGAPGWEGRGWAGRGWGEPHGSRGGYAVARPAAHDGRERDL